MQPNKTAQIFDIPLSFMWFDDNGIFCSVTKEKAALTKEALADTFNFIQKNSGGKKICWIGDVTQASFPTDEAQDFAAKETPKFIKALALITNSELSKLIANVFLVLKKPPYPTKLFTNEKDARKWIMQYL